MNTVLAHQRCFNHTLREAVARCPECGHFYCRECITEHDDRIICAACLKKLADNSAARARPVWLSGVLGFFPCVAGLVVLWIFFYLCGEMLLRIPQKFHEGTVWMDPWNHAK